MREDTRKRSRAFFRGELEKILRETVCFILIILVSLFAASLALFAILDTFPASLPYFNLQQIKYFAVRATYIADPSLVFVYRKDRAVDEMTRGDLYRPSIGASAPQIPFLASYNKLGFRQNTSQPPFEVAVIGDSFVEDGETDSDTLTERIKTVSGKTTFNLGRAWYGPIQYVEVLRRYAIPIQPNYVFFCFFSGNDISDIEQYKQWMSGGSYYFFRDPLEHAFFKRYTMAVSDIYAFISKWLKLRRERPPKDLGVVRLAATDVLMRFGRFPEWSDPPTVDQLIASDEWQTLGRLLAEFKILTMKHKITPVVVYIPTKMEVYGSQTSYPRGRDVLEKVRTHLRVQTNAMKALIKLTEDLDIKTINLLPHFKRLAGEGKLLYYPFDSHWNSEGKQAAAEIITESMKLIPQQH